MTIERANAVYHAYSIFRGSEGEDNLEINRRVIPHTNHASFEY